MVQHANRKRVIKLPRQRQSIDVRLNDVRVRQRTRCRKRRFNCTAEIDPDDVFRAPTSRELRMTSLAAAAFEHHFTAKEFRGDRCDPAEKLFRVTRIFLSEMLPLPTETRRRRALV